MIFENPYQTWLSRKRRKIERFRGVLGHFGRRFEVEFLSGRIFGTGGALTRGQAGAHSPKPKKSPAARAGRKQSAGGELTGAALGVSRDTVWTADNQQAAFSLVAGNQPFGRLGFVVFFKPAAL